MLKLIDKEGYDFNENQKFLTAGKKLRRYSMSTKEKFIRLCLELLTAAVGITPLMLLYNAAQGGFSDQLYGFRQVDGFMLQIWQYGLLAMSTICILAAMRVIQSVKETYLRWRVAHSFRIIELDAHLSQSIGPSSLKLSKIAWITAIVMVVLGGAVSALHNTAFTIHKGQLITDTFAHTKVSPASGGLRLLSSLQFQVNCSSYRIGTLVRKLNTCPFGLTPEGMMDYLANSQVANDTGMREYEGMVFSDQKPVPTIVEIMNGTINATATYSNVPLFDYTVDCSIESNQTLGQQVTLIQPGKGENGIPGIFYVEANDTKFPDKFIFYSVAAWGFDNIVGMASFSYGNGTGKIVFPTTKNQLNRTVCGVKYTQQQGDVYIDFSRKNATVTNTTTVTPNKGQLEIADYTILSLQHLSMVVSQLYRSPFDEFLGNNTDGKFSTEFLAMQIKLLLRKGHYLINTGFGTTKPIEGTFTTIVNQFNDIKLIRLVLFIQIMIHVIGVIVILFSFCTPIIAAEVYSASTWWAFGAHAASKPVDGCTGIMSKEHRNRRLALRETGEGHLQMTIPTDGNVPSEECKYAG
ncbi:15504_t:CDS:1 [Cetraspora pellucida]|uniref:15504_t:CDS:1 n=1 Tax=Cetraspora pellucida TaxID=1433469 RepID=A0A9N9JWI9_9GLOM|nr:15504_t:CDS:1 [Cetraspora pellucida]